MKANQYDNDSFEGRVATLIEVSDGVRDLIDSAPNLINGDDELSDPQDHLYELYKVALEDLNKRGIYIDEMEYDSIMDNLYSITTIPTLLSFFNIDNYENWMQLLSNLDFEKIKNFINEKDDRLLSSLILTLSEYIESEEMQKLCNYIDSYVFDTGFIVYLNTMFIAFENKKELVVINDEDEKLVNAYMTYHINHIADVTSMAMRLIQFTPVTQQDMSNRLKAHDRLLVANDVIIEEATRYYAKSHLEITRAEFDKLYPNHINHELTNKHHIEYFIASGAEIEIIDAIELVSDCYDSTFKSDEFKNKIKSKLLDKLEPLTKTGQLNYKLMDLIHTLVDEALIFHNTNKDKRAS